MAKTLIKAIMPKPLMRRLWLANKFINATFHNVTAAPPLLIFAMPKTGTSTVEATLLQSQVQRAVYKVHRLSHEGIQLSEERLARTNTTRFFTILRLSKIIRSKINANPDVRWQVITLVREPIAQAVSGLFQGIEYHHAQLIHADGTVDIDAAMEFLKDKFEGWAQGTSEIAEAWYDIDWYDREMKPVFETDVYDYPYCHDDGFTIIRNDRVDLLVTRAEDLNRSFGRAIAEFLNLSSEVRMRKENLGQDKRFYEAYTTIKQRLRLPREVCDAIYASRYAQHFYTREERAKFIEMWGT